MSHKVHPKAFRIRSMEDWLSRWFEKKRYSQTLKQDILIRDFLEKRLKDAALENIEIERFPGKIRLLLSSARPGIIIGRRGSGIEELRKALKTALRKDAPLQATLELEIREIKNPWESPSLSGQWIAQQLEKRMPARRVMKQALDRMMGNKAVEGARVEISGRIGGADMARRVWLQRGRLPRQTLRSIIDYALKEAKTRYGTIGVKVWIYKGEKFE